MFGEFNITDKDSRHMSKKKLTVEKFKRLYEEDSKYQKFVKKQMDKAGIDSPADLTKDGKRKFFNWLGTAWDEDNDTVDPDATDVTSVLDDGDIKEGISDAKLERMVQEELSKILSEGRPAAEVKMAIERPLIRIEDAVARVGTQAIVERIADQIPASRIDRVSKCLREISDVLKTIGL
jgi:hypothetical protein